MTKYDFIIDSYAYRSGITKELNWLDRELHGVICKIQDVSDTLDRLRHQRYAPHRMLPPEYPADAWYPIQDWHVDSREVNEQHANNQKLFHRYAHVLSELSTTQETLMRVKSELESLRITEADNA